MAIDLDAEDQVTDADVLGLDEDASEVEDTEDGGAIIRLRDEQDLNANLKHFANIVDEVDHTALGTIVTNLIDKLERDKEARAKRDKLYEEGLRRTGLGDDAPGGAQFSGASRIVHPMLIEACVDFSARVMKEMFPPGGPVKTKMLGVVDKKRSEKARRKAEFMNWQTTEQMQEFRGELEQLTTQVPLGGGQYLKLMWNPQHKRPGSEFVAVDDILLPFAATNFYTAERKTHVQYITADEYKRRVKAGMYADVDIPTIGAMPERSATAIANDKIEGKEETSYNEDGLRTVFEIYTFLDIEDEGDMRPYILSVDKSTNKALALYRNWDEGDTQYRELEWIVEFPFIPWRGAYPIGLTHMIGGLSGGATGALRALLDSAHIQNIPTLLKLKGGPDGQTITMQPTEIAEIDGGALVDDIRKLVMGVPFNQPSPVLFQLLGFLIDAGKGVVQTSFEKLSDQNPNAPVGTTLALIEQGMVVFSSIHSRIYASMSRVFKILHRINSAYLTEEDLREQIGEEMEISPADFDGPMDIIPVADPHIFSETQRFAQLQAVMQRSALVPALYDARKVEERFLESLKLDDDLLVKAPGEDDLDPVSENVAATMGRPIYALPKQDHMAHLQCHMAFISSPLFGAANPVIARTMLFPMVSHLRDHLLNYYMVESHRAAKAAVQGGHIQDNGVEEVGIIMQVQQAIEQQLGQLAQELPKLDQQAQQYAPKPPPMPQDNSLEVAKLNAQTQQQITAQKLQSDQQRDANKTQVAMQTAQQKQASEQAALQQSQAREQFQAQQAQALAQFNAQQALELEQLRLQAEADRSAQESADRMTMNREDNMTAMRLAAAEIQSGEKIAYTTGTGINPTP